MLLFTYILLISTNFVKYVFFMLFDSSSLSFLFICHNHDYLDSKFTLSEPFSTITLQLEIFTEMIIPSASCRFNRRSLLDFGN